MLPSEFSAEESLFEANQRALKDYEQLVERIAALGQTLGNARRVRQPFFVPCAISPSVSVPCNGLVISLVRSRQRNASRRLLLDGRAQSSIQRTLPTSPVRDGMTGRAIKSGAVVDR